MGASRTSADGDCLRNNALSQQVVELLERNAIVPKTLSEIGCGSGDTLRRLGDLLGDGVALTAFEASAEFQLDNCPNQSAFDVTISSDVDIEDWFAFLRAVKSKATYKIFLIPLDFSLAALLRPRAILDEATPAGRAHCFTKETALSTLAGFGYEIVDYDFMPGRNYRHEGRAGKMLDAFREMSFAAAPDWAARIFGGQALLVLVA